MREAARDCEEFARSRRGLRCLPWQRVSCDREADAFRGVPRRRRGSSGRNPLLRIPAREQTKMHRVGVAFVQLTRSTFAEATAGRECLQPPALRARCTWKGSASFRSSQPDRRIDSGANCENHHSVGVTRAQAAWLTQMSTKMHRARCSLVRLSTDRRRSDCLSESHQPRALRPRCTRDITVSGEGRQASCKPKLCSLRIFLYNPHILASGALCSTKDGTMSSPSRVRFRPLPRLTFRFRVLPFGRASS